MKKLKSPKTLTKRAIRKLYNTIPILNVLAQLTEETDKELYALIKIIKINVKQALYDTKNCAKIYNFTDK